VQPNADADEEEGPAAPKRVRLSGVPVLTVCTGVGPSVCRGGACMPCVVVFGVSGTHCQTFLHACKQHPDELCMATDEWWGAEQRCRANAVCVTLLCHVLLIAGQGQAQEGAARS
jgi:hypothetical protein